MRNLNKIFAAATLFLTLFGVINVDAQSHFVNLNGFYFGVWDGTQQTSDGEYIMAGTIQIQNYYQDTLPDGYSRYLGVIKTNANGDTMWTRVFNVGSADSGATESYESTIGQVADGGYLVVSTYDGGWDYAYQAFTKLDANGNILWTKGVSQNTEGIGVASAVVTNDGKLAIIGHITEYANAFIGLDYYRVIDSGGVATVGGSIGTSDFSEANLKAINNTNDGGFIITGDYEDYYVGGLFLVRLNSCGNVVWADNIGNGGGCSASGSAVQQTSDGGFIVTGYNGCFDTSLYGVYLNKTDGAGNLLWSKTIRFTGFGSPTTIYQTWDGGYYIGGYADSGPYLIKTDGDGNVLWAKSGIGGQFYKTHDGGYVAGGLAKMDSLFNTGCSASGTLFSTTEYNVPSIVTHEYDGGGGCGNGALTPIPYAVMHSGCTVTPICPCIAPTPTITHPGPLTICNGGSMTLNAGVYYSYLWNTGATTQTITVATNGVYSVTVNGVVGCTGTASIPITFLAFTAPTISSNGPLAFCDGGSVTLHTGLYNSYLWNTGATTSSITAFGSQPYCVTTTSANGCSGTACTTVTVYTNPTPTVTTSGNTTFCQGGSVLLNGGVYAHYHWSNGATTQYISATTSGNYVVTVSTISNCSGTASRTVTVNAAPTAIITGPSSLCTGSFATLAVTSNPNYHWSNGATTASITIATGGNYIVTVTNSLGCTATTSRVVTLNAFTSPIITPIGPTSFCQGGSVSLMMGTYSSYLWSTGATSQSIFVNTTGTYIVTVSNANGCSGTTQKTVIVNPLPMPTITVTGLTNFCGGGSATLAVTGSYSNYHWSSNATTATISTNISGTYSVTITNSNGCTGAATTTLNNACNTPTALTTTNITATSAMINWTQPTCAYGYSIQRSIHNANIWTTYTVSPNTHYTFSSLAHNTTYDWQIRTNCNAAQTITSAWSATQTFTTLSRLEEGGWDAANASFNVFPNPANDHLTIVFSSNKEAVYTLRLMDVTGRMVINQQHISAIGDNLYEMNLSTIPKGLYLVLLQNEDGVIQRKVVVE